YQTGVESEHTPYGTRCRHARSCSGAGRIDGALFTQVAQASNASPARTLWGQRASRPLYSTQRSSCLCVGAQPRYALDQRLRSNRPHLNPLPEGEEGAKRPVRVLCYSFASRATRINGALFAQVSKRVAVIPSNNSRRVVVSPIWV